MLKPFPRVWSAFVDAALRALIPLPLDGIDIGGASEAEMVFPEVAAEVPPASNVSRCDKMTVTDWDAWRKVFRFTEVAQFFQNAIERNLEYWEIPGAKLVGLARF